MLFLAHTVGSAPRGGGCSSSLGSGCPGPFGLNPPSGKAEPPGWVRPFALAFPPAGEGAAASSRAPKPRWCGKSELSPSVRHALAPGGAEAPGGSRLLPGGSGPAALGSRGGVGAGCCAGGPAGLRAAPSWAVAALAPSWPRGWGGAAFSGLPGRTFPSGCQPGRKHKQQPLLRVYSSPH